MATKSDNAEPLLDNGTYGQVDAQKFAAVKTEAMKNFREGLAVNEPGHMYSKDSVLSALCCCCCTSEVITSTKPYVMAVQVEPDIWRSARSPEKLIGSTPLAGNTIGETFDKAVARLGDKRILGTRSIKEYVPKGTGPGQDPRKDKLGLGPYEWLTYNQLNAKVQKVKGALLKMGLKKGDIVTIFSDTRYEWMATAQACWSLGFPVGTAYANLGVDALKYGVNQMKAKVIVCEATNAAIVGKALPEMKCVEHAIFFSDQKPAGTAARITDKAVKSKLDGLDVLSFDEICSGPTVADSAAGERPGPNDLAVIMYTSGSTGNPKGVMLTHSNAVAAMSAFDECGLFVSGESHCAVYPLAHIMEICVELGCLMVGMMIGYGTTKTMVTGTPFLTQGTQGDLAILQPTFLLSVPLILDRLKSKITAKLVKSLGKEGWEAMYNRAKQARDEGRKCRAVKDTLVFNKVRAGVLGSNLKTIICGSAPLSKATEEWASVVLGAPILQGYAMTETTCAGTLKWPTDFSYGSCGAPFPTVQIKMIDWEEGLYKVHPQPADAARGIKEGGEILISGPTVAAGYFEMPEKTAADFKTDKQGRRWFHTGDVGIMDKWGGLKIIDRKKDIKKLLGGEYISYGKIEPIIKSSDLIDNAMVYADSTKTFCVVVVSWPMDEPGATAPSQADVEKEIKDVCKKAGLKRFEIPQKVYLEPTLKWDASAPHCMTTTTFKIKRANVKRYYEDNGVLEKLYA